MADEIDDVQKNIRKQ